MAPPTGRPRGHHPLLWPEPWSQRFLEEMRLMKARMFLRSKRALLETGKRFPSIIILNLELKSSSSLTSTNSLVLDTERLNRILAGCRENIVMRQALS